MPNVDDESVFAEALEIQNSLERAAFLDQACAGNAGLRKNVESLLAAYDAGQFLEAPAPALVAAIDNALTERTGARIGPYKLIEQIGEGGFGAVFMAEQLKPVRRTVALKVIKPGMDSKQVVARFEAERQALAMMDHPNIAKVLGAGATDAGRPYFVMELVRGIPITDYCDQAGFNVRVRLQLFVQVCRAVQHAHMKGIIHRDLKPGNVLVTSHDGVPVPYVIDFGVAKALGQQLSERSVHTGFAQLIGTPLYMSPEQAELNELGVDTRSDIYSLGVLLYELLTGATPFDKERLRTVDFDEMRRILREEEPPRPSTRLSTLGAALSTVSERRGVDPRKLSQTLQGELDWIVLRALEKDRNRRYETASAFATDVERYLQDEPVQACPPSLRYRLGKFLRRHRRGVLTTAALLVLGVGVGWVMFASAERRAEVEQAVAEDLREAGILQGQDQLAKATQALERAKGRLEGTGLTALQARVEQQRREVRLVEQLGKARMQMLQVAGRTDRDYAGADQIYAAAFAENGLDFAALSPQEAARLIEASAIHAHIVKALDNWAYCQDHLPKGDGKRLRDIAQAADGDPWRQKLRDPILRKDRAALEKLAEDEAVLAQAPELLLILFALLEDAKAEKAGIRLLKKAQPLHPADFWINYQLANSLGYPATAAEAVAYGRAALAIRPESVVVYLTLANAVGNQGLRNEPEAEALTRKAMVLQPENPHVYNHIGNNQGKQGKHTEAEAAFRKAIELDPKDAKVFMNLGIALGRQGKFPAAEAACRKAIDLNPKDARMFMGLGIVLGQQGKFPEAEVACRNAIELDPEDAAAYKTLGMALRDQRKLPEAEAAYRKAIEFNPTAPAYSDLGGFLSDHKNFAQAESAYLNAIELDPKYALAYLNLGITLVQQQKLSEAVAMVRKAVELDDRFSFQYNAASVAALAGCGQDNAAGGLDAKERARLRGQALGWLRACLTLTQKKLEKEPAKAAPGVQREMRHWQDDSDFAGVRDAEALAKLPEAERREWRIFWAEVEELRLRAAEVK